MADGSDATLRIEEHSAFLRAVARRLIADPSGADDLVQETVVRALVRRPTGVRCWRSWLLTVARNVWRDQRAAERSRRRRERDARPATPMPGEAEDPFGIEQLSRALQALPAPYRRVLQAHFYAQRSLAEMATEFGVPLSTVKTRLRRALHLLRADMERRLHGERRMRAILAPLAAGRGLGGSFPALGSTVLVTKNLVVAALCIAGTTLTFAAAKLCDASLTAEPASVARAAPLALATNATPLDASVANDEGNRRAVVTPVNVGPVRGRMVYANTGQGLPFARIEVRDQHRHEIVHTDREGKFTSDSTFSGAVEVLVRSLIDLDAAAASEAPSDLGGLRPSSGRRTLLTGNTMFGAAGTEAQWHGLDTLGNPESLELQIVAGPTYFIDVQAARWDATPPAGPGTTLAPEDWFVALTRRDVHDVSWMRDYSGSASQLQATRAAAARYWVRIEAMPNDLQPNDAQVVLFSRDGYWSGSAAVSQVAGVDPHVVPFELRGCGVVCGTLRDQFGQPRADSWVLANLPAPSNETVASSKSDARGRYRLTHVPSGSVVLSVLAEDLEDRSEAIGIVAGQTLGHDITVQRRAIGGCIAGTITTESGREFGSCAVQLTSRHDTSIWRRAELSWQDVDGRRCATFAFDEVPLVACDVTLRTFEPCATSSRQLTVTAPQDCLQFHIDDTLATRAVTFQCRPQPGYEATGGCTVVLRGEAGWQLRFDRNDFAALTVDVPRHQGFEWQVVGPTMRTARGHVAAGIDATTQPVLVRPGYSTRLHCMDIKNFSRASAVAVFADDVPIGVTDEQGDLSIDLASRPQRITLDPMQWHIFHDEAHRSSVDRETHRILGDGESALLHLYVQRAN